MPSSRNHRPLRTGYTTGTCAAAAAKAGVHFLRTGERLSAVDTPLPTGERLTIPIARVEREGQAARATVTKDGGDDPDATHGHEIQTLISIRTHNRTLNISLDGGKGVGRATLPGLPINVGEAAINPEPRKQILAAVAEAAGGMQGEIQVLIEVPQGEIIAEKTMNPRLGITGGISILGTQGIVKPYSHESYKASIAEALDVARAAGLEHAVFTTGRRTERLYLEAQPETNPLSVIQAADFFGFACRAAAERGFRAITWSLYFGKLVKQAQGLEYTHAKTHPVDFALLADHCEAAGVPAALLPAIRTANTARQVLEMIENTEARQRLTASMAEGACAHARAYAGADVATGCVVFDFEGTKPLHSSPASG